METEDVFNRINTLLNLLEQSNKQMTHTTFVMNRARRALEIAREAFGKIGSTDSYQSATREDCRNIARKAVSEMSALLDETEINKLAKPF